MWRGLVLTIPLVLLVGCGGDDDEAGDGDSTLAEQWGDDPTFEECFDGLRQIMESIEVPAGFDPQDGLDEAELSEAETTLDAAFEKEGFEGFDSDDDPCAEHVGPEATAATAEIAEDLDPDVLAMVLAVFDASS